MNNYIEFNREITRRSLENRAGKKLSKKLIKRLDRILILLEKFARKNEPLLDIGFKSGLLFQILTDNGFKNLYGIDISEEAVNKSRNSGFSCEVQDVQEFELNRKFGTIVISHCLEHCPEPSKVIENIYKHLKPNGILLVEVPEEIGKNIPTKNGHYYCFSSLDELISFFPDKWELLYNVKYGKNLTCVFRKKE